MADNLPSSHHMLAKQLGLSLAQANLKGMPHKPLLSPILIPRRRQLIEVLRQLHAHGIHHHDIRPENVMVNDAGVVTLVDFDRARWVDGPCPNCSDFEVLASMERETTGDSSHTLDNSTPSFDKPAASYL
ncbi:hypothetical protein B0H12DRAFT_309096 [Mycena haematopus]|nr:hypothetical protein B0H12DRAFT_309096 [Mycena haematopus]